MALKVWFLETRPQFLLLSVVLAFLGNAIAWYDGYFHLGWGLLAFFGLLLCHIAVNVLNDYFDYTSGIDLRTKRTPFSGGSGILPAGLLRPKQVFWFGLTSFLVAVPIGGYFVLTLERGWQLLPLIIIGTLIVFLYNPVLTRLGFPEWVAGLGLGTLPVLGVYFVQTSAYPAPAIIASIPSGILVHNLLFLNEFPDVEADRKGGRRTMPIVLGKKNAGLVYIALTILVYLWIIGGVVAGIMPIFCLISLLTLPWAVRAIRGALKPERMPVSALADNVLVVLITQLLLGIGYILGRLF